MQPYTRPILYTLVNVEKVKYYGLDQDVHYILQLKLEKRLHIFPNYYSHGCVQKLNDIKSNGIVLFLTLV